MKESEMKDKLCMKNLQMARLIALLQKAAGDMDDDAIGAELKVNSFCAGSECAHWKPDFIKEGRTLPKDDIPEGDGWAKQARESGQKNHVSWYRMVQADTGDCGLKSQCNASCG